MAVADDGGRAYQNNGTGGHSNLLQLSTSGLCFIYQCSSFPLLDSSRCCCSSHRRGSRSRNRNSCQEGKSPRKSTWLDGAEWARWWCNRVKPDEDDHEEEQDDDATRSSQMRMIMKRSKMMRLPHRWQYCYHAGNLLLILLSHLHLICIPHLRHPPPSQWHQLLLFFDVERKDLDEHEPHEQDMMIIHENKDDGSDSSSRSSSSKISSSSSCTSFSSSASSSSSSHVPTASSLSEVSVHPDEQSDFGSAQLLWPH